MNHTFLLRYIKKNNLEDKDQKCNTKNLKTAKKNSENDQRTILKM